MPSTTRGTCRLHQGEAELQNSHILPNWTYRRALKQTANALIQTRNDTVFRDTRQIKEPLLCSLCEQTVGVWDKYAAEVSRTDAGFPALSAAVVEAAAQRPVMSMADIGTLDVVKLRKFGASLFWRAGVSSEIPEVSLGPYESQLREYLLGDVLPPNSYMVLELIQEDADEPANQFVCLISGQRTKYYHIHRGAVFGLVYNLFVGNVPPDFAQYCLFRTERAVVSPARRLRQDVSVPFVAAPRVGALARQT